MAATLPVARGQATCRHTPHCTLPLPPPGVSHQAHAPRTISHSETPPSELHQIRRRSPPTYSHTGRCNDHHHGFCVDQKCQQQAQEFTIEVILCKYSRRGNACSQSGDRSRIARLWPCGGGGGGREGWRLCRRGGKWVDGWWDVWVVVEDGGGGGGGGCCWRGWCEVAPGRVGPVAGYVTPKGVPQLAMCDASVTRKGP